VKALCFTAGPGSSKLGFRTTAAIIFGRLVLVPPAGLGIVTLADKLGFLPPGDKMFKFVLLLQHTMPTSVLSGKTHLCIFNQNANFQVIRKLAFHNQSCCSEQYFTLRSLKLFVICKRKKMKKQVIFFCSGIWNAIFNLVGKWGKGKIWKIFPSNVRQPNNSLESRD